MLRNRALAVLQKTYDDSYLSCSTAIYYEGQVMLHDCVFSNPRLITKMVYREVK
jgi:hypothetical protein